MKKSFILLLCTSALTVGAGCVKEPEPEPTLLVGDPGQQNCTFFGCFWLRSPDHPTWAALDNGINPPAGQNTIFYRSGLTYREMLVRPVNDEAYTLAAYQFIAVQLNKLNGADTTDVDDAFDTARLIFQVSTPGDVAADLLLDARLRSLTLDLRAFNTGELGPGTCECGPAGSGACQSANPALGGAGVCTAFQMGDDKLSMSHGSPTGVYGNVCMANESELSMSGSQVVTGDAYLGSGVKVSISGTAGSQGQVFRPFDLTAQRDAAIATSAAKAALSCDQSLGVLNAARTITATRDGENVICVGSISLNQTVTLAAGGFNGVSFVINVPGAIKLSGGPGGQIRTQAPLGPQHVLINALGNSADVKLSGGGNASVIDGTILAPFRKIGLNPGRVNGQIMTTRNIYMTSGAIVECPAGVVAPVCDCADAPDHI